MLSKLKIFLLSLLTVICIPSISYASKFDIPNKHLVVNGIEIDPSIFPRTVGLVTPDKKFIFCTGTIISSDLVMTAAHCVAGMQGKKIHIIHNCQRLKGCSNVLAVKRFSIHYGYDKSKNNWNDIALLLLEEQIFLDTEVLILHPSKYETVFRDAETIAIVGYGRSSDRGASGVLRAGLTGITSLYGKEIILGQHLPEQSNVCFGDSGSSFYIFHEGKKYAVGVASRLLFKSDEQQCGGGSIYTLDGKYRTWIEKEYTRMLVDTLPETNHMKINQGCNFSYYRNFINHIDYIFFIAIAVLFAIRRKSRL